MKSTRATSIKLRHLWAYAYGYYAVLTLAIMGPLLTRGYILTQDMVFTPHIAMPVGVSNSYVFQVVLHVLNLVLPAYVVQKLMLCAVLFFGGLGMHKLYDALVNRQLTANRLGAFAAGTFYVINPFVYSRFMAGQYYVLLGVAALPWVGLAVTRLARTPNRRNAMWAALAITVLGIVSIHLFAICLLMIMLSATVAAVLLRRRLRRHKPLLKWSLAALGLAVAASSYWFIPLLLGSGSTATAIAGFGTTDQQAFATTGGSFIGQLASVLRLQGFWADARGLYVLPSEVLAFWPLVSMLTIGLVLYGAYLLHSRKPISNRLVIACTAVAALAATGFGINWLGQHFSVFAGFREPQKFVSIMLVGYALWFGEALQHLHSSTRRILSWLSIVLLLVPFLWTRSMLWGFNAQLYSTQYPTDWQAASLVLISLGRPTTLFLPWHQYMHFGFAERLIANPAQSYFGPNVITSKDPEFGNLPPESGDSRQAAVDAIAKAPFTSTTHSQLYNQGVRYVLIAKEGNYQDYPLNGFNLEFGSPTIAIYKVQE